MFRNDIIRHECHLYAAGATSNSKFFEPPETTASQVKLGKEAVM
jgi:hypothetical protein